MYKKLAIQTIIYSIGSILPKIINYFFIRFFTFSLKRGEFSLYTDMYSISFLIIGFLSFGLENSYFRFLYKKKYNKLSVFSTVILIQLFIALFFLILSIIFMDEIVFFAGYKNHSEYFLMFFFIIFIDTICILPMSWLRINNKPLFYTAINIIVIFIQSILTMYMFFCLKNFIFLEKNYYITFLFKKINSFTNKTGYIFFANLIASISNLILVFPILLKGINFSKFNFILAKKIIKYSIPIMFGSIAFSINENLDKILIKRWTSDNINGSYSACYKIASFMSLYMRVFKLGVEPFFFKKSKESNAKIFYEEVTYLFILFGLIFYVLICGNISLYIDFLIEKKYHTAISIIPIIMMGNLFLGIYTNMSIFYKILNKPFIGTFISLLGVLITLVFNIFFILYPKKYFIIPAWGTFASYGSMLVSLYFWNKINLSKFCKNINSVIIHFLFAILVVFIMKNNEYKILNLIIQTLYLSFVLFFERSKFLSLLK